MFSYTRKAVLEEWTYDEHGNLEQHVVYETKDKPYKFIRYSSSSNDVQEERLSLVNLRKEGVVLGHIGEVIPVV